MKFCRNVGLALALAALVVTTAAPANAQTTFFGEDLGGAIWTPGSWTNAMSARASFLAMLTAGVGTEDFESFPLSATNLSMNFPGAGTATMSGGGVINYNSQSSVGRLPTSGVRYWETSSSTFSVSFDAPVAAFGFYGIDIGDFQGQLSLSLVNGGTVSVPIPHTVGSAANGSVLFFGYIDVANPFTSVTFSNSGSGVDYFGFDDMTIGSVAQVNVVPEPISLVLLGTGLLGIGGVGAARRRREG